MSFLHLERSEWQSDSLEPSGPGATKEALHTHSPTPKVAWRGWGKEEWKQRHCCASIFNGLSWESQCSWGPASPVPQMLELTGQ